MSDSFVDSPLFIGGHPKSGTSLLRALLDGHPEVLVFPEETAFFRRCLPALQQKGKGEQIRIGEKHLLRIFTWNHANPPESQRGFEDRDYSHIDYHAVQAAYWQRIQARHRHPGDLLAAAVLGYGDATGRVNDSVKIWAEKTPYNEIYARTIFDWWQHARVIQVVRDPRDNYVSYQRKHPDWTAEKFASNWLWLVRVGLTYLAQYGAGRYWILKYEDLISEPEQTILQLCAFLGIQNDPSLLIPTRDGTAWEGNSMFAEKYRAISSSTIGRWKEHIAPADLYTLQAIAQPGMQALGYVPESITRPPEAGLKTRFAVLKERIKWWFAHR